VSSGKWRRAAKSKAKKAAKQAWANQRKAAATRRTAYRKGQAEARALKRSYISQHRERREQGLATGSAFWAANPLLSYAKDHLAQKGHEALDRRDFKKGRLTPTEFEVLKRYPAQSAARSEILRLRKEVYEKARAANQAEYSGSLQIVHGGGQKVAAPKKEFKAPSSRKKTEKFSKPKGRKTKKVRKDRIPEIAKSWGPLIELNGSRAVAADGDLSGAISSLMNYAEQYPETRSQVNDHLAVLGYFGDKMKDFTDSFTATLSRGVNEENPGFPPEVIAHLKPILEAGEIIKNAAHATIAAWEEHYAPAIQAAQDDWALNKNSLLN